ncbi:MAG: hypothetical protein NDI61_10840 [Bdellovibrionaceae bacterium]|nr:hypothetical protein [Pseudobdellovibrionaceae bacterium]
MKQFTTLLADVRTDFRGPANKAQASHLPTARARIFSALFLVAIAVSVGFIPDAGAQGRVEVTDMTDAAPDEAEATDQPKPRTRPNGVVGRRYSQDTQAPPTGREAAQKYMGADRAPANAERAPAQAGTSAAHYLAIHLGTFVSDDAYKWGRQSRVSDVGNLTAGVTYRVGEWVNSMDLALRLDFSTYDLPAGEATKISVLPVVLFPDANSQFPLYFGGGVGAGIMAKTTDGESALALEYQLLLGARFFEVVESTGFFVEAGIKNHLHLFSDGQFNGQFIAAGAVFTF